MQPHRTMFPAIVLLSICWMQIAVGFGYLSPPPSVSSKYRHHVRIFSSSCSDDTNSNNRLFTNENNRRSFLQQLSYVSFTSILTTPKPAQAAITFPVTKPLSNKYVFMRAGTTRLEEEDILSTNPLFLTNQESGLSERGIMQVQETCREMEELEIPISVIKYSFAASSLETAEIAKNELKVGQNRVVPEFNFMDPRAVGRWDMMSLKEIQPALVALDEREGGMDGKGGRPPPNEDGTPHETLADNAVRLAQLMSVLESQYAGDTILLVFPDGTSPALLSCMIAGIPYNKCHILDYAPGEYRVNVDNAESTVALFKSKAQEERYATILANGKLELEKLQSMKTEQMVSKKDLMIEKERQAMEAQQQQIAEERRAKEEAERLARERQQLIIEQERQRAKEEKEARQRAAAASGSTSSSASASDNAMQMIGVIGTLGAAAFVAISGISDDKSITTNGTAPLKSGNATATAPSVLGVSTNDTIPEEQQPEKAMLQTKLFTDENIESNDEVSLYNSNADNKEEFSVESKTQAAKEAMDNYLDQDDGGEAWLQVMQEIMFEDDEKDSEGGGNGFDS